MDYKQNFISNMKTFIRFKRAGIKWNDTVDVFHMMDCISQCSRYADLAINTSIITVEEYNHMCDLIFKMRDQAFEVAVYIRSNIWSLIQDYTREGR